MGIAMPDKSELPPGPLRDLVAAVHELYADAAMPGTSRISKLVRERDDLPDTVSHEMVNKLLHGRAVPRWEKLSCVVRQLCDMAVSKPPVEATMLRFRDLWLAVERSRWHGTAESAPPGHGLFAATTVTNPPLTRALFDPPARPFTVLVLDIVQNATLNDSAAIQSKKSLWRLWGEASRIEIAADIGDGIFI